MIDYLTGTAPGIRLIRFVLTIVIGATLTRGVIMPITGYLYRGEDQRAKSSITNLAGIIALFTTFVLAFNTGGFGDLVTVLTALGAAATVAVGFGVRDQIANLAAGVLIHLDNPFIVGDYIRVGEQSGRVTDIKLRTTTIKTRGGKHILPNGTITTSPLQNKTRGDTTTEQITTELPTKHVSTAKRLLEQAVKETPGATPGEPCVLTEATNTEKTTMKATYTTKQEVAPTTNTILTKYTNKLDDNDIV